MKAVHCPRCGNGTLIPKRLFDKNFPLDMICLACEYGYSVPGFHGGVIWKPVSVSINVRMLERSSNDTVRK